MTSCKRRCLSRQGVLLLQPALPPFHLLQDQAQRARGVRWAPQSRSSAALRLLCPTSVSHCVLHKYLRGRVQCLGRQAHRLRSAWPSRFNVSSTHNAKSGEESKTRRGQAPVAPNPDGRSGGLVRSGVRSRSRRLNRGPGKGGTVPVNEASHPSGNAACPSRAARWRQGRPTTVPAWARGPKACFPRSAWLR